MELRVRPIDAWPGEPTRYPLSSPFSAHHDATMGLLDRELTMLKAKNIMLQMAYRESDLRLDGGVRANARLDHEGVVLAFDSRHGPLKYACDRSDRWKDNLRAIALALEALRRVDRYGISSRGEQYTGWSALAAAVPMGAGMSREEAARFIARHAGDENWWEDVFHDNNGMRATLHRDAAKVLHPDRGGNVEDFIQLRRALEILEAVQ